MTNEIDKIQELACEKYYKVKGYYQLNDLARICLTQSIAHMYAAMRLEQAAKLCEDAGQNELSKQILGILKYREIFSNNM